MRVDHRQIVVTTGATGAGTASSGEPWSGFVVEVRNGGTILDSGGSADYTITRKDDGGTILALTNVAASPWQYQPRPATHTVTGGTTNYAAAVGPVLSPQGVPVDGYVQVVIAQGGTSVSGTLDFYIS
ncbi:MAG: hypothetical protein NUW01_12925 [Gemmatimonadaceae bacterium]|nr:hypothetical protein [Gemmatimonadaceae bacterium]